MQLKYAKEMESHLNQSDGDWIDPYQNSQKANIPGSADVIFIPYLERMNASLAYYKGFNLRKEHPAINNWFKALETFEVYRGTQGDFHTHAHDLPPQMGGCWKDPNPRQQQISRNVDNYQKRIIKEKTIINLENIKEIGVHLSIDDFGTGYSSFNYLR